MSNGNSSSGITRSNEPYNHERELIVPFQIPFYVLSFLVSAFLLGILPLVACLVYGVLVATAFIATYIWWIIIPVVVLMVLGFFGWIDDKTQSSGSSSGCGCLVLIIVIYQLVSYASATSDAILAFASSMTSMSQSFWGSIWGLFDQLGVVYWFWIPFGLMMVTGVMSLLSLVFGKFLEYYHNHFQGVRYICPHSNCASVGLPHYECPSCHELFEGLVPTVYGIFSVGCPNCGCRMKTSWLWGRESYQKRCAIGHHAMDIVGLGKYHERRIVLAGAKKSGKTSFITRALVQWNQTHSGRVQFGSESIERTFTRRSQSMSLVTPCPPTRLYQYPEAIPMAVEHGSDSYLAYFYDSDGSEFNDSVLERVDPFYQDADGIILFIDPFCEPSIQKRFNLWPNVFLPGFQVAVETADVIASKLCIMLEHIKGTDGNASFDVPITVVITKTDMFDLYKKIDPDGFPSVTQSLKKDMNRWSVHSQKVRHFLNECGLNNFVSLMDTRFKNVVYFMSSSYGNIAHQLSPSALAPLVFFQQKLSNNS